MSHSYASLKKFKAAGFANITGDENNDILLGWLESASAFVEQHVGGRQFFPSLETRYFSGNGRACIEFPSWDIISVTTLKEDNNTDAVYEVTWATTDYILGPDGNDPTDHTRPRPYWKLDVDSRSTGDQDVFLKGQRMYQMVGKFGYCDLTEAATTVDMAGDLSAAATELVVASPTSIGIGDTLLIESEYLYVTGQLVPDSATFTVSRGANGSTAAIHLDATAVSRQVYPKLVETATLMEAYRMFELRRGAYQAEGPAVQLRDVYQQLDQYKRLGVA